MVTVTYHCDRVGCDATESLPIDEVIYDEESRPRPHRVISAMVPDGWAFEFAGLDEYLHCPEHVGGDQ